METENESSRRELAKDPKRKAKSNDRFKQHLIGGYSDIVKCPKTTKEIAKEINDFMQSKKKSKPAQIEEDSDDEVEEIPSTAASNTLQIRNQVWERKARLLPCHLISKDQLLVASQLLQ